MDQGPVSVEGVRHDDGVRVAGLVLESYEETDEPVALVRLASDEGAVLHLARCQHEPDAPDGLMLEDRALCGRWARMHDHDVSLEGDLHGHHPHLDGPRNAGTDRNCPGIPAVSFAVVGDVRRHADLPAIPERPPDEELDIRAKGTLRWMRFNIMGDFIFNYFH